MADVVEMRPRLPGTMRGLVASNVAALTLAEDLDDGLAELGGVAAQVERYLEGRGGDPATLLLDVRDALRMVDLVRGRSVAYLRRVGVRP